MGCSGLGVGALSCVAAAGDLAPKDHQPRGLTAALCRPHRKDAAQGVLRGGAQSLQCTGSISREAGREQERGCRGGEGHGRMAVDEDGGKSPFPGSPGPALVSQPLHTLCPSSLRWTQLGLSLPTCPAVPKLKCPTSTLVLHFCERSPSPHIPSHPSECQSWDLGKIHR